MNSLVELHDFAVGLAQTAMTMMAAARPRPDDAATKKDPADWVTPFDQAIERHVRQQIAECHPRHRVIGEEYGVTDDPPEATFTWYVDPIDGTTNFVHGLPWASFSLAGCDEHGVAVGVVADAARAQVLSAVRGGGTWIDGEPARCAPGTGLAGGILLTEWSGGQPWPGMFDVLTGVSARFGATRIMGSCALALASVGVGRATAALLPGRYNMWDVAAGALIAREGGAQICGRGGLDDAVPADGMLAAVPGVTEEVFGLWRAAALPAPVGAP